MKKMLLYISLFILLICSGSVLAQEQQITSSKEHHVVIKTNLVGAALGNINLAGEIGLNPGNTKHPLTLHVPVSYNPFTYGDNAKLKHFAVQPELRLWQGEAFNKFFVGLHAHYAYYNVGGISGIDKSLKENRYQGNLLGMGVSGGYTHMINDKFGVETVLGVGYAFMKHDVHDCQHCGSKTGEENRIYFGPTKLAISLVYKIR
jgi:hypothetical protein